MIVQDKFGRPVTFLDLATNHEIHQHCIGCGSCLLDPEAQRWHPVWCIGCARKIESHPKEVTRPWIWKIVLNDLREEPPHAD